MLISDDEKSRVEKGINLSDEKISDDNSKSRSVLGLLLNSENGTERCYTFDFHLTRKH